MSEPKKKQEKQLTRKQKLELFNKVNIELDNYQKIVNNSESIDWTAKRNTINMIGGAKRSMIKIVANDSILFES